jgi:hypothetical protein
MDDVSLVSLVPILIPTVAFVILAIVAIVIYFAFRGQGVLGQIGKALAAGVASPQQIQVERTGLIGQAMVLDRMDVETVAKNRVMVYHMGALVLEVRLPGMQPYRAPCRQWFISSKWSAVMQGNVVPVRVDAQNPQIVFVDLEAIDRARDAAENAEREAHARRQAELLGQNRR